VKFSRLGLLLVVAVIVGCSRGGAQQASSGQASKLLRDWSRDGVTPVTAPNPDGSQSLAVLAWNGYYPLNATAKAGVPAVLRVYTNKTYDCSRAFLIPELKVRKMLPPGGVTEIAIPAHAKGSTLFGTCSMGMYTFNISFE
jgi:uncharacterized protein